MDKIRIDLFDILGYIIPGSALLMIGWVGFDSKVQSIGQIYESVHQVDKKTILAGFFLSYFLGFSLHILGSYIYGIYTSKKLNTLSKPALTISEKWTIIREFGEKHVHLLERWYALRAFSQNLSAMALISFVLCLFKYFKFGYYEWLLMAIVLIVAFFIFINRARVFHKVLNDDMNAVLNKLKLADKCPPDTIVSK